MSWSITLVVEALSYIMSGSGEGRRRCKKEACKEVGGSQQFDFLDVTSPSMLEVMTNMHVLIELGWCSISNLLHT